MIVEFTDRLGSDSQVYVDGRFGPERVHATMREQAYRLRLIYTDLRRLYTYKGKTFMVNVQHDIVIGAKSLQAKTFPIDALTDKGREFLAVKRPPLLAWELVRVAREHGVSVGW